MAAGGGRATAIVDVLVPCLLAACGREELGPGNGGSWRDPSPLPGNTSSPGTTQYAVTQVSSTCGEGRLCTSTHPGAECSLATVSRREQ